jgi:signal transduction histidine kinase
MPAAQLRSIPPPIHHALFARYVDALRDHVGDPGPGTGDRAQGIGRAALAAGCAISDLVAMHEQALAALLVSSGSAPTTVTEIARSGFFLAQALMPVKAEQRAVLKANRLLKQRNTTLRLHTAALAKANKRLEREVKRRKRGELAVLKGKEQYQALFLESQTMQAKLRQLTRQIISAQEEERKEISRELHDEVVQTLVGINVQLSALGKGAATGLRSLKTKIAHTQRLVEHSVNEVHRFARELRPAVLDDLGLIPALLAYSKSLAARKRIKIRLTTFAGVESLSDTKRTMFFRVAQEALTNVVRHAQATQAEVVITKVDDAVRMEVRDNGKSFAVETVLHARTYRRLGLVGMRERIEMVGGRLVIESEPGRGTIIRAEIPFETEKKIP